MYGDGELRGWIDNQHRVLPLLWSSGRPISAGCALAHILRRVHWMRFGAVAWGSWSWVTVRDRASGAGDGQGIDHFQICGLAVGLFNSLPGGGANCAYLDASFPGFLVGTA
jgi:hypothetical protein